MVNLTIIKGISDYVLFDLGVINIAGDVFQLTFPTYDYLTRFFEIIDKNPVLDRMFSEKAKRLGIDYIWYQSPQMPRKNEGMKDPILSVASVMPNRSADIEVEPLANEAVINRTGFIPMLIPIHYGTNQFDRSVLYTTKDGTISFGGAVHADGMKLKGSALTKLSTAELDHISYLGIGNSGLNKKDGYTLPWVIADGCFMAPFCIVKGVLPIQILNWFRAI